MIEENEKIIKENNEQDDEKIKEAVNAYQDEK